MKFLVIRFSSIGDIVLTTPLLRCLKAKYPDAELHFLTKASFKAVTEGNPHVDRFHYYAGDLGPLVRQLRAESFDTIIDLHDNIRSRLIRLRLGKPSLTYEKLGFQKFLLTRFHVDRMPRRHVADRYLDAVRPLGVEDDGAGLEHFIPQDLSLDPELVPAHIRSRYIALCIGASYATKRLPPERLMELCGRLQGPVVLVGGKEDAETGARIAERYPGKVFNACGRSNLHQSALIVREARLVISHDTGMQHIACAFQKPVLAIWGGTSPELQFGPYYGKAHQARHKNFITPGLGCQPCSNHGKKKCPKGHFDCMLKLDLGAVADAAAASQG